VRNDSASGTADWHREPASSRDRPDFDSGKPAAEWTGNPAFGVANRAIACTIAEGLAMFIFVGVLGLVLLICCWIVGDLELRTKLILTLLYLGSWALVFVNVGLLIAAQALMCIVLGFATFGPDLSRR
jgi:hypothetical protein